MTGEYHKFWNFHDPDNTLSQEIKDLIVALLQYYPEDRYDMESILNDAWFNKKLPDSQEVNSYFKKELVI